MLRGSFWKEFSDFIQEYKIVSVGVAFVMGQAINELVKSFVSNIFMPLLNPLIPQGTWKTAVWQIWKNVRFCNAKSFFLFLPCEIEN